jgi:heme oxygenase (biliverdin-IX-beta and delta-forming)
MDLLSRLKAETRPHHDRVEAVVNPMRPGLTREEYAVLLARFHGFHAAWEEAAGPAFAAHGHFFDRRRKVQLLGRDLQFLGFSAEAVGALPRCPDLRDAGTLPAVLGGLYVMEGSTLGGLHISRHLARTLGLTPDAGCAFFAGYGDQTGPMWQETRRFLTDHGTGAEDAVVASAVAVFDHFTNWFRRDRRG